MEQGGSALIALGGGRGGAVCHAFLTLASLAFTFLPSPRDLRCLLGGPHSETCKPERLGRFFSYSWSIIYLQLSFFAYSPLRCFLDTLSYCKQRSSTVSKKARTVRKKTHTVSQKASPNTTVSKTSSAVSRKLPTARKKLHPTKSLCSFFGAKKRSSHLTSVPGSLARNQRAPDHPCPRHAPHTQDALQENDENKARQIRTVP